MARCLVTSVCGSQTADGYAKAVKGWALRFCIQGKYFHEKEPCALRVKKHVELDIKSSCATFCMVWIQLWNIPNPWFIILMAKRITAESASERVLRKTAFRRK